MKFTSVSDYAKREKVSTRAIYKRIETRKIYATEIDGKKYVIEESEPEIIVKEIEKIVHKEDTTKINALQHTLNATESTLEALKDENANLTIQLSKKPQIEYVEKEIEVVAENDCRYYKIFAAAVLFCFVMILVVLVMRKFID